MRACVWVGGVCTRVARRERVRVRLASFLGTDALGGLGRFLLLHGGELFFKSSALLLLLVGTLALVECM